MDYSSINWLKILGNGLAGFCSSILALNLVGMTNHQLAIACIIAMLHGLLAVALELQQLKSDIPPSPANKTQSAKAGFLRLVVL